MAQEHPTAAAMASFISVQGCRLPRLNPPNFPTPSKFAQLRREKVPQQGQHAPRPQAKATTRPQQWLKGHPPAAAMASYTRSRVPFAKPQTLQTLQKFAQLRREKVPQQAQHAPLPHAKPPQGHSNGSRAPHGRSNGFFIGVQGSRLPGLKPSKPSNSSKSCPTPQGKGTPTSPTRATLAGKSHHKATAMAQGHPTAAAMASYTRLRLPFARPQTLQTLQKSAQLRREKVPQQAQHTPLPHAKATTRPQQWLKGTPRPQQWLLIGVQVCHLPGLKPSKSSKSPPNSAAKGTPTSQQAPRPHAKATTRPKQWLKGTPRPQQWLLLGVQGCRLPGLKRSKPSNSSKSLPNSAGKRYPQAQHAHARRQRPPQGHSNGSRAPPAAAMASYRRSSLPFARPQTLQTLQILQADPCPFGRRVQLLAA